MYIFPAHKMFAKNKMYYFFCGPIGLAEKRSLLLRPGVIHKIFRSRFIVFCFHLRRMTFGKVNELGQFIREAEPEPDVKKSKGRTHTHTDLIFLLSLT